MQANPIAASAPEGQNAALSQAQFMRLLLAQLTQQDPLEPTKNEQFLAQMAQFSALSQAAQTVSGIQSLLATQQANQGIALMGKMVEVRLATGSTVKGSVVRLAFDEDGTKLTVRPTGSPDIPNISLSQVTGLVPN